VFGLGKLGLLLVQVAKLNGLNIIGIDGSEKKLKLGKKFGAYNLINRLKIHDIAQKIRELTNGLGADIVIDTSGNPNALKDIIQSCRTRGKLHMKSTHGLATPIDLTDMVVRELTMYTSRCGPFEKAIEALNLGKINVKEMISNEFSLENIDKAIVSYEKSRDHIKCVIKVLN
jgi:alcohol dehydrogenase